MQDLVKYVEEQLITKRKWPEFKAGDTVVVTYRIVEGEKERTQDFQGVVIQRRGRGPTETFTVRKISSGIAVERIFPVHSPFIANIEVVKHGKVRRARLFYLRKAKGKAARIKERRVQVAETAAADSSEA